MDVARTPRQTNHYEAALDTAHFLALEGKPALALEVTRSALEALQLEKETAPFTDAPDDDRRRAIEAALGKKYLAFRSVIEGQRNPYVAAFIKTAIVAGVASLAVVLTSSVVVMQFRSVVQQPIDLVAHTVQETIRTEAPKLTADVRAQIPTISQSIRDQIPEFAQGVTKATDEKISRAIDQKIDAAVRERLPAIVEARLGALAKEKKD